MDNVQDSVSNIDELENESDSRKRRADSEIEDMPKKKTYHDYDEKTCHVKFLVPRAAAGKILGKGGETILKISKETNTRFKMSSTQEFYPGTNERVALLTGNHDPILKVLEFVYDKINDSQEDTDNSEKFIKKNYFKFIVRNSTAGMIIGKAGAFMKQIKEESGAYVKLSPKSNNTSEQERCVTIAGDKESILKACSMVVSKVQDDPANSLNTNIRYGSGDMESTSNNKPSVPPFAFQEQFSGPSMNQRPRFPDNQRDNSNGLSLNINITPNRRFEFPKKLINDVFTTLTNLRYSEKGISEITSALVTLAEYGALTNNNEMINFSTFNNNSDFGNNPSFQLPINNSRSFIQNTNANQNLNNAEFDNNGDNSFTKSTVEIQIPENLIGSIIGPGGKDLIDLQNLTRTTIQISNKGVFAPGTDSRIVTLNGLPINLFHAKSLIQKRLEEEKLKRDRRRDGRNYNSE